MQTRSRRVPAALTRRLLSLAAGGAVLLLAACQGRLRCALAVDPAPRGCDDCIGGAGCGLWRSVDLHSTLAVLPQGVWTVVGAPLKCFAAVGAGMSRLSQLSALDLSVSRIALGALNEAQATVRCPAE